MGWVVNATTRPLYPGKNTRYPLYGRLGGLQGRSGRVRKISPPTGFDPRTAPACIESRYRLSYSDPSILRFHGQLLWVVRTYSLRNEIAKYIPITLLFSTSSSCVTDAGFIFNVITNILNNYS
jgi:hypothetical protein